MPQIHTRVVIDIATSRVLESDSYDYAGDIALCKGAGVAQAQQQQELGMQNQAFQQQMQTLNQLQSAMSPYLSGQIGYSPQLYGAMQSQFLNNNAAQFQNAGQAVRSALLARGGGMGDMPTSGDYTRGISSLMGAAAQSQAQGILGLQQANAQQALQNQLNAGQLMMQGAGVLGQTQGVAGSGASSALNSYIQAKNTGILQSLASGFGQGLGGGLGAIATGGLGGITGGIAQAMGAVGSGGSVWGALTGTPKLITQGY